MVLQPQGGPLDVHQKVVCEHEHAEQKSDGFCVTNFSLDMVLKVLKVGLTASHKSQMTDSSQTFCSEVKINLTGKHFLIFQGIC